MINLEIDRSLLKTFIENTIKENLGIHIIIDPGENGLTELKDIKVQLTWSGERIDADIDTIDLSSWLTK